MSLLHSCSFSLHFFQFYLLFYSGWNLLAYPVPVPLALPFLFPHRAFASILPLLALPLLPCWLCSLFFVHLCWPVLLCLCLGLCYFFCFFSNYFLIICCFSVSFFLSFFLWCFFFYFYCYYYYCYCYFCRLLLLCTSFACVNILCLVLGLCLCLLLLFVFACFACLLVLML